MFSINYKKRKNDDLFKQFEKFEIKNLQNYIPLYSRYFDLNNTNWNSISLNHNKHIKTINEKKDKNTYSITIDDNENVDCFIKYSPLVNPSHYLTDCLDVDDKLLINSMPNLNTLNLIKNKTRYLDNFSGIDSFFTYLSCKLNETHNLVNGIKYYDSFIGNKYNFEYNIYDDLDEIFDCDFFMNNLNKKFILNENLETLIYSETKKNKKKIVINNDVINIEFDNIEDELSEINTIFTKNNVSNTDSIDISLEAYSFEYHKDKIDDDSDNESIVSNNTTSVDSDEDYSDDTDHDEDLDDENESLNDNCSESSDSDSDESIVNDENSICTIDKFPIHIICMEKLTNTLDYYYENNTINNEEWISIMTQITMTLLIYQKAFDFTHNDLHSNNVMYIETNEEYIYYLYNNTYLRVKTFGKIWKIIDFGRSIYKYKNNILCSDNFYDGGDSYSQYNFGPFYNKKKDVLMPSKSFDLSRLATSLYDNFYDEHGKYLCSDNETEDTVGQKQSFILSLLKHLVTDENGKNILYKENGDERNGGFKLYRFISKKVINCEPEYILKHFLFNHIKMNDLTECVNKKIINIDTIPIYYTL